MEGSNLFERLVLEALLKVVGPAILFKPDVLVKGKAGMAHMMLWGELPAAIAKKYNVSLSRAEQMIDTAPEDKIISGFITSDGRFVNRQQAWNIAKKYNKTVQGMAKAGFAAKMASEYL